MKNYMLILFLVSGLVNAQMTGVNTRNPSATLDIVSSGNTATTKAVEINNSDNLEIFTVLDNGNVGIGVDTPVAQLHTTGTVRMESLGTNTINTKVMTTDDLGNITTRLTLTLLPEVLIGGNALDAVTSVQTISSVNNVPSYTTNLFVKSFTITQTSLVTFSYSLGVLSITQAFGAGIITDGASKLIGAQLIWKSLPSGSPFIVNDIICTSALPYSSNGVGNIVTGTYYPSNNITLTLIPGSYSFELQGFLNAVDSTQGIKASFGGNAFDRLDVVAIEIQ